MQYKLVASRDIYDEKKTYHPSLLQKFDFDGMHRKWIKFQHFRITNPQNNQCKAVGSYSPLKTYIICDYGNLYQK